MAPEMAEARVAELGPWTDVYLLGAVLYEILSGRPPHRGRDLRDTLRAAVRGEVHFEEVRGSAELVAVCRKAMAPKPEDRFASVGAFSEALRSYLRHRESLAVTSAAQAILDELPAEPPEEEAERRRHYDRLAEALGGFRQALALWEGNDAARDGTEAARMAYGRAALAGGDLQLAAMQLEGLETPEARALAERVEAAISDRSSQDRRARRLRVALATSIAAVIVALSVGFVLVNRERARADANAREARANELAARTALADVERLADGKRLRELEAQADELWPPHPRHVAAMEQWISEAEELIARIPQHRTARETLHAEGVESFERRWRDDLLGQLLASLEAFRDSHSGILASVAARLRFARDLERRSIIDHAEGWEEARRVAREESPYRGFDIDLAPQIGLVPLGQDPRSGLLEFLHLQTHAGPLPDRDGDRLTISPRTGIIMILLPGGRFAMGAQAEDAREPHYDPQAQWKEGPVHEVTVGPFFMAKHETTQGQWIRVMGTNPALFGPDHPSIGEHLTLLHPAEQLSWHDVAEFARRSGLLIPTEAQWEYAARAGTDTIWSTGDDPMDLAAAANVADQCLKNNGGPTEWPYAPFDDGSSLHAEIGSYDPNRFGIHDTIGNIAEWCREQHASYEHPVTGPEAERLDSDTDERIFRGGAYSTPLLNARSAARNYASPGTRDSALGARFARPLDPR
jgi:formylglycine-generating enzyme required for sulfatase activity